MMVMVMVMGDGDWLDPSISGKAASLSCRIVSYCTALHCVYIGPTTWHTLSGFSHTTRSRLNAPKSRRSAR